MDGGSDAKTAGHDSPPFDPKDCSVKVAVHIRPLIPSERNQGCKDCISVVPGLPQVQIGNHSFTFDHVYGSMGSPSSAIFDECVASLVDGLFQGYNATVLAYGQTGSGKTYTMGTACSVDGNTRGVIPLVIERIFRRIDETQNEAEVLLKVSFIEILKEEVHDLLDPSPPVPSSKPEVATNGKSSQVKPPIQIRETHNGGITLTGVHELDVSGPDEMASALSQGSLNRATGSTNMNNQSSRSHAIFTIHMVNKRKLAANSTVDSKPMDEGCDDFVCAKLHLVDLAGSERAKRTGADGLRFKEGVHINKGLLALGNVISALGDEKKRKDRGHVPYRDSKLTRLLQDSLGGNSRTLMIACVSPADSNAEETLNTLKYANRARNIQNKAVVNRDPLAAEMQRLRRQVENLQAELLISRAGGISSDELQILKHKISRLEEMNAKLCKELQDCQVENERLSLKLQKLRDGKSWEEIENEDESQDVDIIKGYLSRIRELENEVQQLQAYVKSKKNSSLETEHETFIGISDLHAFGIEDETKGDEDEEEVVKELEHTALQDEMDKELQELDKRLEQKEAEMMKLTARGDTALLTQHYEKKFRELEEEKKDLQKEMDHLKAELEIENTQKIQEQYLQKLRALENQIAELKKKQENQAHLLRQKQKSDEAAKRLQEEILRIKQHKVQLQHKMKQESEQFRAWKASREKELLQLKKEGRRNEYEMHKLQTLNQRQKLVLQRKTEEAAMATKRLKELLESRKHLGRDGAAAHGNGSAQTNEKVLQQNLEHELEVVAHVHEVRSEYERQNKERVNMAMELEKLKEDSKSSDDNFAMSPGARNARVALLEGMLITCSSTLVDMASQLSEAEERERAFTGKSRWKDVRSIVDAKNLLNYLFNAAAYARCQLLDKDVELRKMKEALKGLACKYERSEVQRKDLEMQLRIKEHMLRNRKSKSIGGSVLKKQDSFVKFSELDTLEKDGVPYDLRKVSRNVHVQNDQTDIIDLEEDMEISDGDDNSDEDWEGEEENPEDDDLEELLVKRGISGRPPKPGTKSQAQCDDQEDKPKPEESSCCSCRQSSGCKTKKCECRAAGNFCGPRCGCKSSKCSNRETTTAEGSTPDVDAVDVKTETLINEKAAEGAVLLQNALRQNLQDDVKIEGGGDVQSKKNQRKPLSDIGNTTGTAAGQDNQRKKWKKRTSVQLVLTPAQQSSVTQPPEAAATTENFTTAVSDTNMSRPVRHNAVEAVHPVVEEPVIPLRLPRSMHNLTSPLRARNSSSAEELNGEASANAPATPGKYMKGMNGKENLRSNN